MFRTLLESKPARIRSRSAAVFSFIVHGFLVATAVAATASRVAEPVSAEPSPPLFFIPTRPEPTPVATRPRPVDPPPQPSTPSVPNPAPMPPLDPPTTVPTGIPPVDPNAATTVEPNYGNGTPIFESDLPGTGSGDPFAGIMWAEEVEVAAAPLGRQRQPRYPEVLRSSRTEGGVTVMYVVDSTGRVEPESFKVIESSHALFEPAVKAAILAQRFRPAKWRGGHVRQLVQQRFVFTLDK